MNLSNSSREEDTWSPPQTIHSNASKLISESIVCINLFADVLDLYTAFVNGRRYYNENLNIQSYASKRLWWFRFSYFILLLNLIKRLTLKMQQKNAMQDVYHIT